MGKQTAITIASRLPIMQIKNSPVLKSNTTPFEFEARVFLNLDIRALDYVVATREFWWYIDSKIAVAHFPESNLINN